ncbi:hypothetical protein PHYPSEUDO_002650 [Phytophthora pseudosyringae]|uniref:M96 mating-specific protein family n=1 Tax=Phytophthora pseudosyringae TaxID=221518 RepID=A0A8T1VWK8_9STRA|nr:hypothetical protein PHYPSEUDO_002650 [Phytophthora pseudosyringae]
MASELEAALALLDETPAASTELQLPPFPSSVAEWEPEFQWGVLDDDIGDFGGVETSAITVPAASESATVDTLARKKKRKKKMNPNKARDARRFQLVELHEQAAELEFTLKRLHAIKSKRATRIKRPSLSNAGVPPVWQDICTRQLGRRLKAERENIRLKKQHDTEKQLVTNLEKLLYKRHAPSQDEEPQATKQTRRTGIPAGYIERMAAMVFNELEAGVKMCHDKVESMFDTKRLVPTELVKHSAVLDGGKKMKGTERKFYDRRTMPFDMRATGDAWWENWHNYRGQRFRDIVANEITESFGLEMSDFKTNTSATAYAQQVSQRHIEDDRIVFVWDAYVEPFGFANERVGGVYLLEQNYVLVEPAGWSSERACGDSNGCATRVSTCYVLTPYFLEPKLKEDAKTMAVINFLVSALSTNIMALSEMVETMLLDQVLQQCGDK